MVKQRLQSAVENSTLKSVSDDFIRSFEHSTLGRAWTLLLERTRASRLYRWLTTEPESMSIVIDLRKTHSVGPVLAVLDAATPQVTRFWEMSRLAAVARAIENVLSGSKTAKLAAKFLEPPEPPANSDQRE
ncbi:hypothetical protein [Haloarcula sp. Atlit-120R]|uniref:hypothetical protein n=1 Tax=Haloarcula sp. Atlit-120R TaxID=2282135 RepID=UPI000EF221F6|nr:hypothetical protein [Haloarcula sp. Atlit-120R]RLM36619.1 hypothetical protein DVK01_08320 [Haloarcula sp. Atlit-120R]